MIKIWSELPGARTKELVADVATIVWVLFWGNIVWQLFQFLSSFAEAGRTVRAGGQTMVQGGRDLGDSLAGLPLVGAQVRDVARQVFGGAGRPLSDFGTQLEQFIFVVAHRAIRKEPDLADAHIARALAMRAFTRLDYTTLLEYTPDPLGDWVNGRHDRLARAELASVGLRVGNASPAPGPVA
jgi:hypothetical protein